MEALKPLPSDPVTSRPPLRTLRMPVPFSPTLTLLVPFHVLPKSVMFIVPVDAALVPRTSSPEALAVPPPWIVRVPAPPEPTRTAVPEVILRVASESMVTIPLWIRRESTVRLLWLAALTTPPDATSNWPEAVTLDDESEIESSPVEPIALPETVMLFAEAVPPLLTIIWESVGNTAPKPIRKFPPEPVAAMLPKCSTVTVELPICPNSMAVFVRFKTLPAPVTSIAEAPGESPINTGVEEAFQVEPP